MTPVCTWTRARPEWRRCLGEVLEEFDVIAHAEVPAREWPVVPYPLFLSTLGYPWNLTRPAPPMSPIGDSPTILEGTAAPGLEDLLGHPDTLEMLDEFIATPGIAGSELARELSQVEFDGGGLLSARLSQVAEQIGDLFMGRRRSSRHGDAASRYGRAGRAMPRRGHDLSRSPLGSDHRATRNLRSAVQAVRWGAEPRGGVYRRRHIRAARGLARRWSGTPFRAPGSSGRSRRGLVRSCATPNLPRSTIGTQRPRPTMDLRPRQPSGDLRRRAFPSSSEGQRGQDGLSRSLTGSLSMSASICPYSGWVSPSRRCLAGYGRRRLSTLTILDLVTSPSTTPAPGRGGFDGSRVQRRHRSPQPRHGSRRMLLCRASPGQKPNSVAMPPPTPFESKGIEPESTRKSRVCLGQGGFLHRYRDCPEAPRDR